MRLLDCWGGCHAVNELGSILVFRMKMLQSHFWHLHQTENHPLLRVSLLMLQLWLRCIVGWIPMWRCDGTPCCLPHTCLVHLCTLNLDISSPFAWHFEEHVVKSGASSAAFISPRSCTASCQKPCRRCRLQGICKAVLYAFHVHHVPSSSIACSNCFIIANKKVRKKYDPGVTEEMSVSLNGWIIFKYTRSNLGSKQRWQHCRTPEASTEAALDSCLPYIMMSHCWSQLIYTKQKDMHPPNAEVDQTKSNTCRKLALSLSISYFTNRR